MKTRKFIWCFFWAVVFILSAASFYTSADSWSDYLLVGLTLIAGIISFVRVESTLKE